MERRNRIAPCQLRAAEGNEPQQIGGLGAVYYDQKNTGTEFRLWDDLVERIMPGAFDAINDQERDIVSLFNHDYSAILGRTANDTLTLRDTKAGLDYTVTPNPDTPEGPKVLALARRGDLGGSSFGFDVISQNLRVEDEITIREITKVRLYDIGPVTEPAYLATKAEARALRDQVADFLKQEGLAARELARKWAARDRELELAGLI